MTRRTGAEAVREIEGDVGHCCGDVLHLTGEELADILDQHAAEAVRAERAHVAALAEALETIAALAVGHGDVCDLIARRARQALAAMGPAR